MKKKNFKADMILNKKFSNELSGYNAVEVDEFFDKVIEDYKNYEEDIDVLKDRFEESKQIIDEKEDEIKKLNLEIFNLQEQLKATEKATNVELMKEIRKLRDEVKNK